MVKFFLKAIGVIPDEDEKGALTRKELRTLAKHNPFSKYLLIGFYDEDQGVYYNLDDTIGMVFECVPLAFSSETTVNALQALLKAPYPEGSVLQFICYADPNIGFFLDEYLARKSRENLPFFLRKAFESLVEFYRGRPYGLCLRNFRIFVTLKFPLSKDLSLERIKEIKAGLKEGLVSARLYPFEVTPDILLQFLRRLFNDRVSDSEFVWSKYVPLNKQVIFSETEIKKDGKYLVCGSKYFRCLSPKSLPNEIGVFFGNLLSGAYTGPSGDAFQVASPFMIVFNVSLRELKTSLHSKANLILQQQAFGSFVPMLTRKKEEFIWAIEKLEQGERFYQVMIFFWIYDENKLMVDESYYKALKLWESAGCVVQEEDVLLLPVFVYSLPFGFVDDAKVLLFLDRHFIVPASTLSAMLPVQTDFVGTGDPVLLFVGRKGQIVGLDILSERNPNYNFLIVAPTGKGKSFTANYIVANYYGTGVKVRIVDIGGSYRKLCKMLGGKYLDFVPDSEICFNFFETIKDPQYDLPVITSIITHMTVSHTGSLPGRVTLESAVNIINTAVRAVYEAKGNSATLDDVYEYLANFTEYFENRDLICPEGKPYCEEDFSLVASHLAFNLSKFTSSGPYGRWFSGKNTFDISTDDFVVLELEHLKPLKDLFNVIVLVVLNAVTQDLYLSDKKTPRMVILDEAWQFLQDTKAFQDVIEEGYRRARKYYGSFGIITQSVLDLEHFGRVGTVINTNAGFKFYLESTDFILAWEKKLLPFSEEFYLNLVSSVKYNAPKYSEIFFYSDRFGGGVLRVMVDDYSYFVYTSSPRENAELEELVKSGMSYDEAIKRMIEKYRGKK